MMRQVNFVERSYGSHENNDEASEFHREVIYDSHENNDESSEFHR